MLINKTGGRQTTGQGQAEVGNPGQSQKGTERQAGSGSGQAKWSKPEKLEKQGQELKQKYGKTMLVGLMRQDELATDKQETHV